MKTYEDIPYAQQRLLGTIVRLGKEPIKIAAIDVNGGVMFNYLHNMEKPELCKLRDIDITPVPLGFVNFDGRAFYTSRIPKREDWKQGLRDNTLSVAVSWSDLRLTILGKFPSLREATLTLNKRRTHSIAFDRNWAITVDMKLKYKEWDVGEFIDPIERRYKLNDNCHWVMEALEEVLNAH